MKNEDCCQAWNNLYWRKKLVFLIIYVVTYCVNIGAVYTFRRSLIDYKCPTSILKYTLHFLWENIHGQTFDFLHTELVYCYQVRMDTFSGHFSLSFKVIWFRSNFFFREKICLQISGLSIADFILWMFKIKYCNV